MCLVKNPSSQNPDFSIFGTKDLSREKSTTLGLESRSAEVELQVDGIPRLWDCFAIQLLQSVRSVVQVGCDPKGTFPVGAKLSCSGIFFDLTSDSPYEVARLEGSRLNLSIESSGCSKFGSFFSNLRHFSDFFGGFKFHPYILFILLLLEQQSPCRWFPYFYGDYSVCAICKSVRSFVGDCLRCAVVHPEYVVQFFFPQAFRLVESNSQGPDDDSVSCLCVFVSLRMFDRGDQVFNAQPCQEVFISLSFELSVVVSDNVVWEAVPVDEVFLSEFFHLAGRNFPKWSCFYPLSKVVNGDQ